MAKKEITNNEYIEALNNAKIVKINIEDEMSKSFISYAMAVNVSRAIPDVRDGLKPVHRRILYAMGELNLYSDKAYRKCARIVGDVLGKYHPHGDTAVYDALVRLAQDFSIRCPLVDGQGNFGSVDGDPAAAQRYTEAKLSKISTEMLREIDKNTVDYYPNFDNTLEQPTVLPSRFPNLLVNGADGIAVGMATNIPPHNLGEVIDAVVACIDNPEITFEELISIIPCPDYPTGGIIMGRSNVRLAYKTGRGGVIIRAKADIEEYNNNTRTRIVVTELPYQVNKARLIENIADLVKDKKIEGISDIKEESDRSGMRIVIEVKKDFNAQVVLNTLYKHTQMQISNGITLLALVNREPRILNLKQILCYYIAHQQEVIKRRTQFDLDRAEDKRHIVEGLIIALDDIDNVVALIKSSKEKNEAAEKLIARYNLSDKQANAILEMRLQRLTSLEVEALREELRLLEIAIADFNDILSNPLRIDTIIKSEIIEIKEKHSTPRKTAIDLDYAEVLIGDLIEKEDVVISLTHFGYVKRLPVVEYKAQRRGGKGVTAHKTKEEDFIEHMFISNTHDDLLFFTNFGRVYSIKGYEVPEAQRTARGRAIVNLLQMSEGEKVTAVIPLREGREGHLIMATRHGLIKKTDMNEFASIRKGGKIAISLVDDDQLVSVIVLKSSIDIIIASNQGKCIRFGASDIRAIGRSGRGVRSIKLSPDDYVVDMTTISDGQQVITVSSNGYGKRCDASEYNVQGRAGKGVKAGIFNDKTGNLVNLKVINPSDDIMLIADNGMIIRVSSTDISKISRATKGVRIMKFRDEEAKVVCVALTPPDEEVDQNIETNE